MLAISVLSCVVFGREFRFTALTQKTAVFGRIKLVYLRQLGPIIDGSGALYALYGGNNGRKKSSGKPIDVERRPKVWKHIQESGDDFRFSFDPSSRTLR